LKTKKFISIVILSALSIFVSACSDGGQSNNPIIADVFREDLEFPDGVPLFLTILNLNEPALLTTSKKDSDGTLSVDQNLKEAIILEQEEMIASLKSISPDIKVIYSYKLALNALAIEAPQEFADQISELSVESISPESFFEPPELVLDDGSKNDSTKQEADLSTNNSVAYIGAHKVHNELSVSDENGNQIPVKGRGVRVGIIDSGIDYTHKALGGSGSVSEFENIDDTSRTQSFPNQKVVGGYDFVGSEFGSKPHLYRSFVPVPDENPLDRTGHGTHVAGTVGGLGDGINTYDGVAPEAELFALKVFGDFGGGAGQSSVLAALEFAMDPDRDLDINDKLDVVNLSLGGSYGTIHTLYNVAVKNVTDAGLLVVAAAGNDGPTPNIVGAPSTVDDALSVAALRDNMRHHIEFNGARIIFENGDDSIVEAVEGAVTLDLEELSQLSGKLVYVGDASVDFTDEQKESLNGNVALIDRGAVSFIEKITRAVDANATAVVMVNNSTEDPIVMGGEIEEPFSIPGVMITKDVGDRIKSNLSEGKDVTADLKPGEMYVKEELVGTITGFSSQGPRSLDAAIKPEVAAPGLQIISARVGTGDEGVRNNGTSMASPHVAGAAALLVQYRRELGPRQLKSLIMNSSSTVLDENENTYPISRQGAGLLDVYEAALKKATFSPQAFSLGKINLGSEEQVVRKLEVNNTTDEALSYEFSLETNSSMQVEFSQNQLSLGAGETGEIELKFTILTTDIEVSEVDAFIKVSEAGRFIGNIPILSVISQQTSIEVQEFRVVSAADLDSNSSEVSVSLSNKGDHDGEALLFNLLGRDERKPSPLENEGFKSTACDLQSAGYRIIKRVLPQQQDPSSTEEVSFLQVAVKVFNPVSGWERCLVALDIDLNNDQVADKEVVTIVPREVSGLSVNPTLASLGLSALTFNSEVLRQIDEAYNAEVANQNDEAVSRSYLPALEGLNQMIAYRTSTLAIVEVPVASIPAQNVNLRLTTTNRVSSNVQRDDVLGDEGFSWKPVSLQEDKAGYFNLPESIIVSKDDTLTVNFNKGANSEESLIVYYPRNEFTRSVTEVDKQSETPVLLLD